jgi:riboflavin kinase/FMN adenylyltransferase
MSILTIGNFDGVHLGHQEILRVASEAALRKSTEVVVLTFVPHPRMVLAPEKAPPLLTTYAERRERIEAYFNARSVKTRVVEQAFGREFSSQSAEQFLAWVGSQFSVEQMVVGHDFQFGRERAGTHSTLKDWEKSAQVPVQIVSAWKTDGLTVSSSEIRKNLAAADLESARRLLGYWFSYRGVVVHGQGRGRTIGIPTANVQVEPKLLIPTGVYAVRLDRYEGVANFGVRPTFGSGGALGLECHLFDFEGDLYGRRVKVEILKKIREEARFPSMDELREAIARDLTAARQVHASLRTP